MRIQLLSVGRNMPAWVNEGVTEYTRRMPPELPVTLKEIAPANRGKNIPVQKVIDEECEKIIGSIAKNNRVVLADVTGRQWSTTELADKMSQWMQAGDDITIIIGGPDGVNSKLRDMAHEVWSLSSLTFPHPLVRVMITEQIYRACSIIKNHPYHRA
jgi:23S rRNA (pseudouridine1915-N3)-methyltransferase